MKIDIGRNSFFKKTSISQRIIIGERCKIEFCNLDGNISINNNATISKTNICGNTKIDNNLWLSESALFGHIKIGKNAKIDGLNINGNFSCLDNFKVFGKYVTIIGNVEIGNYTSLNGPNTDIYTAINKVKIGSFCSIARNVSIQEYNHKVNRVSTYHVNANIFDGERLEDIESKGDIIIENDVWIGAQCVILSGSHISNGAIIAANSVVAGFIPPYAIAAGSPAKVIKYRFSQATIDKLLGLKWWEWSDDLLKKNKNFLLSNGVDFSKQVF